MPIFSTLLGVVALGEPLTWYEPIGAAIVIGGAALAQSRDRAAPPPGRPEVRTQPSTKYAPLPCPLENQRLVTVFLRV